MNRQEMRDLIVETMKEVGYSKEKIEAFKLFDYMKEQGFNEEEIKASLDAIRREKWFSNMGKHTDYEKGKK